MVQCKICGKAYNKITAMHARTHDMDMNQYEAFDPFAGKRLEITGSVISIV